MIFFIYHTPEYIGQEEYVYGYTVEHTISWTYASTYFNGIQNFNYFSY
jgi:hypothetical protein